MSPDDAHSLNEQIQRAYQIIFGGSEGKTVLADLAAYCGARRTCFDPDARVHAFNEGRRDVLLRIQEFTQLSLDEIYALRMNLRLPSQQGENNDD